jgi:hypothetical protein
MLLPKTSVAAVVESSAHNEKAAVERERMAIRDSIIGAPDVLRKVLSHKPEDRGLQIQKPTPIIVLLLRPPPPLTILGRATACWRARGVGSGAGFARA